MSRIALVSTALILGTGMARVILAADPPGRPTEGCANIGDVAVRRLKATGAPGATAEPGQSEVQAGFGHLTPAQERILQAPPRPVPEARFRFDLPGGPQFTEEQKQTQREAAKGIAPMVARACAGGAASVRIPPGDYRFGKETWGPDGPVAALEFARLQRDADHPFTIDATGATFWFDLGEDQTPSCHFCVAFTECSNVVFRGATLDRGTHGNIEGRITTIDGERNRIGIRLSPGVTLPSHFNDKTEQRILPFKADGTFCAPLYALQRGGVHLKYKGVTPGTGGICWVEMADTALLDTIRDPNWLTAYGEQGVLRVGDGLSCIYTVASALALRRCAHMTMEDVRVYVAKGGGSESGGEGAHLWKDCYFGPRPGTSRWQGGDGFMFNATRHGTTLDTVTIRHTTDDMANIHGYWGDVETAAGNRVSFRINRATNRAVPRDAAPGDAILLHDRKSGASLGRAIVERIEGDAVFVDRPAEAFADTVAEWLDHECAGWTIQNCRWEDNYQRLMIQTGPGLLRNCTFTRIGSAVELNSVFPYVEGGVPRDITIEGNTFTDVNPVPGGATIAVYFRTYGRPEARALTGIAIRANTFVRPGEAAIALDHAAGCRVEGNRISAPVRYTAVARPGQPHRRQAIFLEQCSQVEIRESRVEDPGEYTAPDAVTGSRALGLGPECSDVRLDGRPVQTARRLTPQEPIPQRQNQ